MGISMIIRLLILTVLIVLSACGFHRRVPTPLSPALERPYIASSAPNSSLTRSLLKNFRLAGANPVDAPQQASTVFTILDEQQSQTLLSVSPTQSSRQYRLSLSITFQITRPDGTLLVGPQTLSESRVLTMSSDQILSSSNETQVLYQQIRIALVRNIMNRLTSKEISGILTESKQRVKK